MVGMENMIGPLTLEDAIAANERDAQIIVAKMDRTSTDSIVWNPLCACLSDYTDNDIRLRKMLRG